MFSLQRPEGILFLNGPSDIDSKLFSLQRPEGVDDLELGSALFKPHGRNGQVNIPKAITRRLGNISPARMIWISG